MGVVVVVVGWGRGVRGVNYLLPVNFECRKSYTVTVFRQPLCAIMCINICARGMNSKH